MTWWEKILNEAIEKIERLQDEYDMTDEERAECNEMIKKVEDIL